MLLYLILLPNNSRYVSGTCLGGAVIMAPLLLYPNSHYVVRLANIAHMPFLAIVYYVGASRSFNLHTNNYSFV